MKISNDFITNSSSMSFVIKTNITNLNLLEEFLLIKSNDKIVVSDFIKWFNNNLKPLTNNNTLEYYYEEELIRDSDMIWKYKELYDLLYSFNDDEYSNSILKFNGYYFKYSYNREYPEEIY